MIQQKVQASDFTLQDINGASISLSDYHNSRHVVLVFNRGFLWPYCRRHMAQLRQDYQQFIDREAEILVVCPENQEAVSRYWQKESLPFVGLADPAHTVADQYDQQVTIYW